MSRTATIQRATSETSVRIQLEIDGSGAHEIGTGIGFFDHMLELFAAHGLFDLSVQARGDLKVDFHHTVEDTGIALGQAFAQAMGEKRGIRRYGATLLPMDEALARVVVDCGGRPFLRYEAAAPQESVGGFSFQLVEEFLRAFSVHAMINLHVDVLAGRDGHHVIEAIFKGLARALRRALEIDSREQGIPSTKGVL